MSFMSNPSARHQMVCAIMQRHPEAVVALAEAVGVSLPEHDDVQPAPNAHQLKGGGAVHTDATIRLLLDGKTVLWATVEMQREFRRDKYLTLHAYHGSGVRGTDAGGHSFVLSERIPTTMRFRAEDAARRPELAFSASFHSGRDLKRLEHKKQSTYARALPAALADFAADLPRTREMLDELSTSDPTLMDLYLRAIVEEIPMAMLGEVLQDDMLYKLRSLQWFRDYEAEFKAEARAEVAASVLVGVLTDFLIQRGDKPSGHAIRTIAACQDAAILDAWLKRAYRGESAAELFPEPQHPAN